MAVSSDSLRLGIVTELTAGDTPATPAFDLMRVTGEGLTYEVSTTQSDEMGGLNRGVKDSILVGATVTGDISFELSKNKAFEKLFVGGLGSKWAADYFGTPWGAAANETYDYQEVTTFSIEKRFTMDDTPTYNYHRFVGCMVDTTALSITPNEPITGTFSFVGQMMATATAEIASSTYVAGGTSPIMTAPLVTGITLLSPHGIDGTTGLPLGTSVPWLDGSCFTGLDLTLANNARELQCIGVLGSSETVLGRFEASSTGTLYYANDEPLDALIDQTEYALQVTMTDGEGGSYDLLFPRIKFSTASVLASGTNTDVMTEFTLQMLEYQGATYALTLKAARDAAA